MVSKIVKWEVWLEEQWKIEQLRVVWVKIAKTYRVLLGKEERKKEKKTQLNEMKSIFYGMSFNDFF